ncbi:MAG TPA: hypothetical protein VNK26_05030 [Pyrinomonadaceae bacterium]|nr:hypothetical protein [Pyrinomonadaceae bacterium]
MPDSVTKRDFIIEVWEALDCESVGSKEIIAIEEAVRKKFGSSALESPMRIARMLADEGAVIRFEELVRLYVERFEKRPLRAQFRNLFKFDDLRSARRSLKAIENLRRKLAQDKDKSGLEQLRVRVLAEKKRLARLSDKETLKSESSSIEIKEILQWINHWLLNPEIFITWLELRLASEDFRSKFGKI